MERFWLKLIRMHIKYDLQKAFFSFFYLKKKKFFIRNSPPEWLTNQIRRSNGNGCSIDSSLMLTVFAYRCLRTVTSNRNAVQLIQELLRASVF